MNSVHLRARAAVFFALFTAAAWLALLSCSSDPTSTLGSDSDLLGSEPGAVYEDTIGVLDDTTHAMHTPIAAASTMPMRTRFNLITLVLVSKGFYGLYATTARASMRCVT